MTDRHAGLPPLTPEFYGDPPAREDHFKVVERWVDCVNVGPEHQDSEVEFFHRQMNEEANVLENAASSLADFPDADWPIRMFLARQCSDEARHVRTYKGLVEARGARVGQFPVMNFQYRILQKIGTLIGRLAVQNRTFEADGLDAAMFAEQNARKAGDLRAAEIYESQGADEILHVGFANEWIRGEISRNPRSALHMAAALTQGSRAFHEVFAGGGTDVTAYGVATQERREAGFDDGEIGVATQVTEERRAKVRAQLAKPSDRTG